MRRKKSHPQGGSCKGLKKSSKAAALTAELSHRQKKRVTNCSQEETLASQMDTVGCKRTLKVSHCSAREASTLDTSLSADHAVNLGS